ncbi:hypothetical protein [Salipaludibacillus daqingensis]|uniref:hypothetical protein n=1 Tax=Salipaludibacillus daqingensis TaxID=3041001 RepID=UPI002474A08C|nr:hypothetical protein [Salipaludibacillus daqingensis]
MRPLVILIIIVIVSVSIRIDLTSGTIPDNFISSSPDQEIMKEPEEEDSEHPAMNPLAFQEVMVESGQTVYGITQKLHDSDSFNISVQEVLDDFEKLNPDTPAHELFADEIYKFPIYEINDEQ